MFSWKEIIVKTFSKLETTKKGSDGILPFQILNGLDSYGCN